MSMNETHTHTQIKKQLKNISAKQNYLNSLPAWVTVLNESFSIGLDVTDLLLPKLQLPHQSLKHNQCVMIQN